MLLFSLWLLCLSHILSGNLFGDQNYFGQPVGTFLLLAILVTVTPVYIVMTVRTLRNCKVKRFSIPD